MPSFHAFTVVFTLFGGLVALFGVGLAVAGARAVARSARFSRVGIPAEGVIVDNQMESRSTTGDNGLPPRSYLMFRPAVRFRTQQGQELTVVARNASRRSYLTGTSVAVLYDPQRPTEIRLTAQRGMSAGVIPLVAGLIFAAFAVGLIIIANVGLGSTSSNDNCPPGLPAGFSCTTP
jgi:hypothetical protein